jgi:hypothetical protein
MAPSSAARPAGFEPAALGFVVRYSIQLSYGRVQPFLVERREWDSNPRYRLSPYTGLANQRLRPLGHLSRSCGGPGAASCLHSKDSGLSSLRPGSKARPYSLRQHTRQACSPGTSMRAEEKGFEPLVRFPVRRFSRPLPSANSATPPTNKLKGLSCSAAPRPAACCGRSCARDDPNVRHVRSTAPRRHDPTTVREQK